MNDLLRIADLDSAEFFDLLDASAAFKRDPIVYADAGRGRVVGILFEKPSLRTRFSVESALARIGAHPVGAYDREIGLGSREPMADAGAVLSGYCDAIVMRTFEHARVAGLAEAASVPVVNALSDDHHPLQALADVLTIAEECADGDVRALKGLHVAYVGDGNNVAHSLIEAAALAGFTVSCACPQGFEPDEHIVAAARTRGATVEVVHAPADAVFGAAAVYTDVWTSMGQEGESHRRRDVFREYRVTSDLMAKAAPGAVFLHCLPAHRDEEVEPSVIDGSASRVFAQATNRMHTAAGVFLNLFGPV
jgi:ornithine carbamoyltransferase